MTTMNEKLLRQIEQGKREWDATLDAIADLICLLDENGRILRANHTIEKWQATPVKQITGHFLSQLIHPDQPHSYLQQFWQDAQPLLRAGQIAELEIEDTTLNRFLRLEAHPIQQASPTVAQAAFAVFVMQDMTLQKQYEWELARQNQSLQALNQLALDISVLVDLQEVFQTAVQSAVHSFQVTSGYIAGWDADSNSFTHVTTYYLPESVMPVLPTDIEILLANKEMFQELARWLNRAQTTAVLQLETADTYTHRQPFAVKTILRVPLQAKGEKVGILELWESRHHRQFNAMEINFALAFGHQISLAIDNAHLYKQALSANRLKTALLANVSHELRTPLGVILIHTEMLQEGDYGPIPDTQKEILAETIHNAQWLGRLIDDFIDRTQLETGQLHLHQREFQPAALLQAVHTQMEELARAKGLTFNSEIAADLPQTLIGDPERIQQILANLVRNAIKFTPEGEVKVKIFQSLADYWTIQVTDTGIGIPKEAQAYVFEPFRQVDDSSTRKQGGSGLGLSIVKQLTELMSGEVLLTSEAGVGSNFMILLPLKV